MAELILGAPRPCNGTVLFVQLNSGTLQAGPGHLVLRTVPIAEAGMAAAGRASPSPRPPDSAKPDSWSGTISCHNPTKTACHSPRTTTSHTSHTSHDRQFLSRQAAPVPVPASFLVAVCSEGAPLSAPLCSTRIDDATPHPSLRLS
jgi:hypothetical protein